MWLVKEAGFYKQRIHEQKFTKPPTVQCTESIQNANFRNNAMTNIIEIYWIFLG